MRPASAILLKKIFFKKMIHHFDQLFGINIYFVCNGFGLKTIFILSLLRLLNLKLKI